MAKPKLKTSKELGITKCQHKNLAKLITFVLHKVEPPKFDIKSFYDDKKSGPNMGGLAIGKPINERIWHMLFSASHKNDKMAAVKRGAWLLQHGLPSHHFVLSAWECPATFRPRYAAIRKASV